MKKIGLIDLHLDEWHANHYPEWFREAPSGAAFEIGGAYEESSAPQGRTGAEWCREMNLAHFARLGELLEHCDAFCVLAPSNPETHERLAAPALRTGKPVFVDKTFAPDRATAERLFALADESGAPLFSSSALRFGRELAAVRGTIAVDFMAVHGGGSNFAEYAIHQLEMIVSTMGTDAVWLRRESSGGAELLTIGFAGGRIASMTFHPKSPFGGFILGDGSRAEFTGGAGMFHDMLESMLQFFLTGVSPVPRNQTILIAELLETALRAGNEPGKRFDLPGTKE